MAHQSIFSDKYLKAKLAGFSLDQVDSLAEKKAIVRDWETAIRNGTIDRSKEEERKPEFLIKFFGELLEYEFRAGADEANIHIEKKSVTDGTKPDAALGYFRELQSDVRVVIEIKDGRTDLDKPQNRLNDKRSPVEQAFSYVAKSGGNCKWVIVSNFKELRLYHASDQSRYEKFDLIELVLPHKLKLFLFLLGSDRLIRRSSVSTIDRLYAERLAEEQNITKEFYKVYKETRLEFFQHLVKENPEILQEVLFAKAQKILDRIVFIRFCECLNLIPDATLATALKAAEATFTRNQTKLWEQVIGLCEAIDKGWPDKNINRFNGGLFATDEILDKTIIVKDEMVKKLAFLNRYDFESDLNVNILGHIFEQSISDIEETKAQIAGVEFDKKKGKKKKDGIFYTPPFITGYIVKEAVGGWLEDRKQELGFDKLPQLSEDEISESVKAHQAKKPTITKNIKLHLEFWDAYEHQLRGIKVLDPACGSGAFLVQVFDFLFHEGQYVNQMKERLTGKPTLFDLQKHILTENIFGVDLNEESVEITKLSLWLKTANKSKELTTLDGNIRCGNSLIDDYRFAGNRAFKWEENFASVMNKGGFDVVIGNPPYVFTRGNRSFDHIKEYIWKNYEANKGKLNLFGVFLEFTLKKVLSKNGYLGFITPETFIRTSTYSKIRRLIYTGFDIKSINLYGIGVFENVTAETITMIIKNEFHSDNIAVFNKISKTNSVVYKVDQRKFDSTQENRFVYDTDHADETMFSRINKNSISLGTIVDVRNGIATKANKKEFISSKMLNSTYKKLLEAPEIFRYGLNWSGRYIRYVKEILHRPRKEETFLSIKLLTQRVSSRLVCAYDDQSFYTFNSINNIILINKEYSLKYILCLLNSRLLDYYYRKNYSLDASFTITVTKANLDSLPIKVQSLVEQEKFDKQANIILDLIKNISATKTDFLRFVISEFNIAKPTTKLQHWDALGWEEFNKELKTAKVVVPYNRISELRIHFEAEKGKAAALRDEIEKTDKRIDAMVYELYNLTPEEIDIVKGHS